MRILNISFKTFVILFWLGMLTSLVIRNTNIIPHSAIALITFTPKDSEEWMGIYFNNRKVGYANTLYRKEGSDQRIIEKTYMKLKVMDEIREVKTLVNSLFDSSGMIKNFNFRIESGNINLEVDGVSKKGGIELKINTGGITKEEFLKIPGPVYLPQSIRFFLKDKKFKIGDKYSIQLLDPSIMKESRMDFEIIGTEDILVSGKKVKTYKAKGRFMGIESITYFNENGEVLREEGPLGTVAVRETREEAINSHWGSNDETDFILATAIPANAVIENTEAISYLKLKISGIDMTTLKLNSGRQKLSSDILEIRKEILDDENMKPPYKLPYSADNLREYFTPSPLIQSDSPEIINTARKIITNTTDPVLGARLIAKWVYSKLEKTPTISIPSALEVLKTRKGDCNEHATLYAALARAVGIPTKIAVGLVYKDGYFFYHAWNEVYIDRWITIDPTFNQFPADVTHIKLAEGNLWEWVKIAEVVGNLRIEILDTIREY